MNMIIMVSGGARSGKSDFSASLALACNDKIDPHKKIAYIATGEPLDAEFVLRIKAHKGKRPPIFQTYEESMALSAVCAERYAAHGVFIVECLTTWLGNIFHKLDADKIEDFLEKNLSSLIGLFKGTGCTHTEKNQSPAALGLEGPCGQAGPAGDIAPVLAENDKVLIVVANELGLGLVPADAQSRKFRDWHGRMNQRLAAAADRFFFLTAGIPFRIK